LSNYQPLVILADDDDIDVVMTKRSLIAAVEGVRIRIYEDGEQALRALKEIDGSAEIDRPSLVLLDFRMPVLSCLDIVERLSNSHVLSEVPFVVFSSSVGPTDIDRCLKSGIREYVEKPTDPREYSEAVADICRRFILA